MALKDKLSITVDMLKVYLRINDTSEDTLLQKLLNSATDTAEKYLCHDFGESAVPDDVETWIINRAARMYLRRGEGLRNESFEGESRNWGEEEFSQLWPYRKNPGM